MGEIAEMMLDGTLCEGCGVANRKAGLGFPWRCGACVPDRPRREAPRQQSTKVACPTCGRRVKRAGLPDHIRDAHGPKETT